VKPARAFPPAPRPRQRAGSPAAAPTKSERDALLRVAAAAAGAHDLGQVLELAAEEARRVVGAASLSVSRWERDRGVLRTLVNVGDLGPGEERYPSDEVYSLTDDRGAATLLEEGLAYFNAVDNAGTDPWSAARLARLGKESEVGVPIIVEGDVWGEVYATTAAGQPRFRGADVRFLEAVAGQLAVAIARAELFSQVSRLAYEDALTGLANRRAVEERLARAVARVDERGGALAVLLCDLDDLKAINDSRGHDAGDGALSRVAEALVGAAAARPGNLVGRLAGDEFCVVLDGGGIEHARALAAAALETLAGDPEPVLISCGAAVLERGVATPTQLLRAADAALYRAKANGGGQIVTAGARAAPAAPSWSGRRRLRRDGDERLRDCVRDLMARFHGDLAGAGALERIEAAGTALADTFNAAAWAVSFAPAGGDTIATVLLADGRDRRVRGLRLEMANAVYALADYPQTEALLRAGSGCFVAHVDDPDADSGERAVLRRHGRVEVLAAAASDEHGAWLLEVYADSDSRDLEDGALDAALLLRAAIPPPRIGPSGAGPVSRELDVVRVLARRLAGEGDRLQSLLAAADELHAAIGARGVCAVRLRDDRTHQAVAGAGAFADFTGRVGTAGRGLLGRCLRENRPVLAGDVRAEPDYVPSDVGIEIRSELDVPIRVGGVVWGALSVQGGEVDEFGEHDVRLVSTVADLLGAALRLPDAP